MRAGVQAGHVTLRPARSSHCVRPLRMGGGAHRSLRLVMTFTTGRHRVWYDVGTIE
jgi:hypothetical protein